MWIMSKTRVSQCHDFAPSLCCPSVTRRACRRRPCQVASRYCLGPHPILFLPPPQPSSQQGWDISTTNLPSQRAERIVRNGSAGVQSSPIRRSNPSSDASLHRCYRRFLDTVLHPELARILRTIPCTHPWIKYLLSMDLPDLCVRGDDLHRGRNEAALA